MVTVTSAAIQTSVVNNNPVVSLNAVVTEDTLPRVAVAVSWGDGQIQTLGPSPSPYSISAEHAYASPGTYLVTVVATNLASPVPASTTWSDTADFLDPGYLPTPDANSYAYIGPIMPNTTGYPSPANWDWQIGTDNACLVSSLTLLLSTQKGERLMDPDFGTNLRSLVFSLEGPIVDDAAFADVSRAISTYEPRGDLTSFTATSEPNRVLNLAATVRSLINGQQVPLQSTNV